MIGVLFLGSYDGCLKWLLTLEVELYARVIQKEELDKFEHYLRQV
jgi:hypothetical protein